MIVDLQACPGAARLGAAGQRSAARGTARQEWLGMAGPGEASRGRRGMAWPSEEAQGQEMHGRIGMVRCGEAWTVAAGVARSGQAWRGTARQSRLARPRRAWCGSAWQSWHGEPTLVAARQARRATARYGSARIGRRGADR